MPFGYFYIFRHIRDAGGICIADEVQTGFGRAGNHFWMFEEQGLVLLDYLVAGVVRTGVLTKVLLIIKGPYDDGNNGPFPFQTKF